METRGDVSMITFHNVSKIYNGRPVFENLAFSIEKNSVVTILGPSGIGKTSILRLINGGISPDSGRIEVKGSKIGYIFQDPRLLPWRTASENISLGLKAEGMEKKKAETGAVHWMKRLGLAGFESYYPSQLSGGMMQRVSIGRALAIRPDLLLMDEPFSNLNMEMREDLLTMLEAILRDRATTVVYVTHDIREAVRLSDKIISLHPGSVVEEFYPRDFERLMTQTHVVPLMQKPWSVREGCPSLRKGMATS